MPEEIEKLLDCSKCKLKECIGCEITYTDRKKIRKCIEKAYWEGYITKQNEAMEICKQCKYVKKSKKLKSREQKLIEKLEEIENRNAKLYNSDRQKEVDFSEWELANEILAILKGEKEV